MGRLRVRGCIRAEQRYPYIWTGVPCLRKANSVIAHSMRLHMSLSASVGSGRDVWARHRRTRTAELQGEGAGSGAVRLEGNLTAVVHDAEHQPPHSLRL